MKQLVQQRTGAAHFGREAEGVLHLAKHLRLAYNERVEPRCHAEEVGYRVMTRFRVEMRAELIHWNAVKIRQKLLDSGSRRLGLLTAHVELNAVARRYDRSLVMRKRSDQCGERPIDTSGREV